jgi:hypothetical protein
VGKFRNRKLYELVGISEEGFVIKEEGSAEKIIIHPDEFEENYEELHEIGKSIGCCAEPSEHLLFEALRVTSPSAVEDYEFRDKVKAKLEKLLQL